MSNSWLITVRKDKLWVPYEYEGQENSHNQLWGVALNLSYFFHIIHQVHFAKREEIQCQLILDES